MDGVADAGRRHGQGRERCTATGRSPTCSTARSPRPTWNYRNLVLDGADSDGMTVDDGITFYDVQRQRQHAADAQERAAATPPPSRGARTTAPTAARSPGFTMSFTGAAAGRHRAVHRRRTSGTRAWATCSSARSSGRITGVPAGDDADLPDLVRHRGGLGLRLRRGVQPTACTWTKLAAGQRRLPTGAANLNGSSAWDGPGGLTGNSGGWQQAEFSLGDFSGTVQLRFRYATDEALQRAGLVRRRHQRRLVRRPGRHRQRLGTDADGWLFTTGLQDNDWTADAYVPYAKAGSQGLPGRPGRRRRRPGHRAARSTSRRSTRRASRSTASSRTPRTGRSGPSASSRCSRASELT